LFGKFTETGMEEPTYSDYEKAVHKAISEHHRVLRPDAHSRTGINEQIQVIVRRYTKSLADISRSLNRGQRKLSETEVQVASAFILKVLLDFETLQDLCLMPPKGCPFELWVCCGGPCKTGFVKRHQNINTLRRLRKCAGIKDNIPEDYYDKFEKEWREIWNEEALKKDSGETDYNTPLFLVPVQSMDEAVKNAIIEIEPSLAPFVDKLFLCTDHFKRVAKLSNNSFSTKQFATFSKENLQRGLRTGELKLNFAVVFKHFKNRDYIHKLLMLLEKGVNFDFTPNKKSFEEKECVSKAYNRLREMENNFGHRNSYSSGYASFHSGYSQPAYDPRNQGGQDYQVIQAAE